MNIAHLIYALNTGGTETMLMDIASEQAKTHNVSIIVINNIIDNAVLGRLSPSVKLYKIGRKPGGKNPFPIIRLKRLLDKLGPDVIHAHNLNGIGALISKKHRGKTVLTVHSTMGFYPRLNQYRRIFAISQTVKNHIKSAYSLDSTVVYNGINHRSIKKKELHHGISGTYSIVQIGRLEHKIKGQDILIRAIAQLIEEGRPVKADFIGEGSSAQYLKELVRDLNLEAHISFLGLKDRAFIYGNLYRYDLLVHPALSEGFGLTIAEAMAARVPVLASNIEAPMEIIQGGKFGHYFISEDANSLKEAIIHIMDHPDEAMTEAAYQHVAQNFTIEAAAENYILNYELALNV